MQQCCRYHERRPGRQACSSSSGQAAVWAAEGSSSELYCAGVELCWYCWAQRCLLLLCLLHIMDAACCGALQAHSSAHVLPLSQQDCGHVWFLFFLLLRCVSAQGCVGA